MSTCHKKDSITDITCPECGYTPICYRETIRYCHALIKEIPGEELSTLQVQAAEATEQLLEYEFFCEECETILETDDLYEVEYV